MKIGILTFHKSINNGAVMQCYSLSKKLQELFPEDNIEVIDYHMPKAKKNDTLTFKRHIKGRNAIVTLAKFLKFLLDPESYFFAKKRMIAFESVADSYLPLSKEKIFDDGTEKLFEYINSNYDIVIAGSDAIWNYNLRGFPNPYFLDESITVKKLSYAASCYGMSYEKIPHEQKEKISKILSTYSFLGVRDSESEKFADFIGCSVPTTHTCDPTVFLDVNNLPIDEEKLKAKLSSCGFDFTKQSIAVMGTEVMCQMVRKMYGNKYQIVSLSNSCKSADVKLYEITPYEWAYCFRFFQVTVTTFFHGTLLSLRNGVPVISIALPSEYSKNHVTKVEDFLKRVGFEDNYFHTDCKTENIQRIKEKIDFYLSTDMHDEIVNRMNTEAESANVFFEKISEIKSELE